jgi:hypothetical protein
VIKPISSGVPITQRIRQRAISKLVNPAQQINASTSNITNLTAAVGNLTHGKAGPFVKPVNARSRFLPDGQSALRRVPPLRTFGRRVRCME